MVEYEDIKGTKEEEDVNETATKLIMQKLSYLLVLDACTVCYTNVK